jgi:hypothetical protein
VVQVNEPDVVTTSLGAYVLGALSGSERAQVETHLAGCAACREELAGLAGLPGLLAQLDANDVRNLETLQTAPAGELADRAVQAMYRQRRHDRRRGRIRTTAAALAVAAVAATVIGGLWPAGPAERPPALGRTLSATSASTGVHGDLQLSRESWGTALHLTLRGIAPGTHCTLVTVLIDGQRLRGGGWLAGYEGTASINSVADASPAQLSRVEVVNAHGSTLVSIPVADA